MLEYIKLFFENKYTRFFRVLGDGMMGLSMVVFPAPEKYLWVFSSHWSILVLFILSFIIVDLLYLEYGNELSMPSRLHRHSNWGLSIGLLLGILINFFVTLYIPENGVLDLWKTWVNVVLLMSLFGLIIDLFYAWVKLRFSTVL